MKITTEIITSRKNPLILLAASLAEKKYREQNSLFLAFGHKLCHEAAVTHAPVAHVILSEAYAAAHKEEICAEFSAECYRNTPLTVVSEGCFEKITTEKAPDGVILIIKHLDISKKYNKIDMEDFKDIGRAILLCSIRDPGNLGTILRSAGAFGASTVIMTDDCADVYHPRTIRAAMGAAFRVPTCRVCDPLEAVCRLREQGRRVFAAELRDGALALDAVMPKSSDVFIIGNEGHGIPEALSAACDGSVYIPIAPEAESLNAAAAAAILLWEQAKK